MDKPTANLDNENTQYLEILTAEYRLTTNATVIWVSHDTEQLKRVTTRQFVLKERELIRTL